MLAFPHPHLFDPKHLKSAALLLEGYKYGWMNLNSWQWLHVSTVDRDPSSSTGSLTSLFSFPSPARLLLHTHPRTEQYCIAAHDVKMARFPPSCPPCLLVTH